MSTPIDFVRGLFSWELDAISRFILICLSYLADNISGQCEISISALAEETACSKTTVFRRLLTLEKLGYIEIERKHHGKLTITLCGFDVWLNYQNFDFAKNTTSIGGHA